MAVKDSELGWMSRNGRECNMVGIRGRMEAHGALSYPRGLGEVAGSRLTHTHALFPYHLSQQVSISKESK